MLYIIFKYSLEMAPQTTRRIVLQSAMTQMSENGLNVLQNPNMVIFPNRFITFLNSLKKK